MKKVFCILALTLLLLSCDNSSRQQDRSYQRDRSVEQHYEGDAPQVRDRQEEPTRNAGASPSAGSGSYSSSTYDNEEEEDNMRGFDPASEDDMDDNGMSRYMENTDEEGWD